MTRQDEADIFLMIEFGNKYYCLPELIHDFGIWRQDGCDVGKAVYEAMQDQKRRNNANTTG